MIIISNNRLYYIYDTYSVGSRRGQRHVTTNFIVVRIIYNILIYYDCRIGYRRIAIGGHVTTAIPSCRMPVYESQS